MAKPKQNIEKMLDIGMNVFYRQGYNGTGMQELRSPIVCRRAQYMAILKARKISLFRRSITTSRKEDKILATIINSENPI